MSRTLSVTVSDAAEPVDVDAFCAAYVRTILAELQAPAVRLSLSNGGLSRPIAQ